MQIQCIINGEKIQAEVSASMRLLDFLREELNLTGAREGCGEGECGACTVILNKKAIHACMTFVGEIDGGEILTVEGLGQDDELDLLQEKFIEHNALQCGFCTPGMLLSAKALLMNNPNPSMEEIKVAISGNLCRCTGYKPIINAISDAAEGGKS